MAKGQITDDELAAGMKGLGGFGAIAPASTPARRDSPFRDSRPVAEAQTKTVELKSPEQPESRIKSPVSDVQRTVSVDLVERENIVRNEPVPRPVKPKAKAQARKSDIYTEKVSFKLSPEMRDEVDELARQLQRSKTSKDERITANTVMRVAIRIVLDEFKLGRGESANNEDELLELVRKRLLEK